jgi:signal peptidase I
MTHPLALILVAAALAAALPILMLLRRRTVVAIVRGDSMAPTFTDGERVYARRPGRKPIRAGDIIIFTIVKADSDAPNDPACRIKRVAAIPGDPLPTNKSHPVPSGMLFIAGDNPRSQDSSHLGLIPQTSIIAMTRRPHPLSSSSPESVKQGL